MRCAGVDSRQMAGFMNMVLNLRVQIRVGDTPVQLFNDTAQWLVYCVTLITSRAWYHQIFALSPVNDEAC
jgi:hypothetical protein